MQAGAKTAEGKRAPGRDARLCRVNGQVAVRVAAGEAVISVHAE
jgi:hypothetical protein